MKMNNRKPTIKDARNGRSGSNASHPKKTHKTPIIPKILPPVARTQQNTVKGASTSNFLKRILPNIGYVENGTKNHKWFKELRYAIDYIKTFNSKDMQVFVAQASFKTRGTEQSGRTQDNAAYLKNFFLDIECGKGKPYASQA